jgi:hypothetical protein
MIFTIREAEPLGQESGRCHEIGGLACPALTLLANRTAGASDIQATTHCPDIAARRHEGQIQGQSSQMTVTFALEPVARAMGDTRLLPCR